MAQFDKRIRKYDQDEIRDGKELFILEQFAQLKSPKEVAELYISKFPNNKKLSAQTMRYYKETRAPIIEQLRDKFIFRTMTVPIANEKVRLKRTEDLYIAASNVVKRDDDKVLSAVEVSLKCLKEAREEVKGESGSVQNFLQLNQYNELTNNELIEKKRELEYKFIELSKKGVGYEVQST